MRQLMAAELIYARGAPPEATYVFKHALVQDTAYASLLRSRRQRIHADIARALEERFADQVDAAPAIIAHHYTEAGLAEPAARYWLAAAELALSRSANAEADRYVDAGLALIPRLTDGPDRQSLELALQIARANALLPLKGFNAPETVAALTAAKRLLDAGVGTDLQRFSVLYGLCTANYIAARHGARARAGAPNRGSRRPAGRHDLPAGRLPPRSAGADLLGQKRQALEVCNRPSDTAILVATKLLSYRFGIDPGLAVLCFKILRNDVSSASSIRRRKVSEQVRAELPSHGHAPTVAACILFADVWPEFHARRS